jgi:5-methylcytosine-specific restriction endonuclease McrA
MSGNPIAKAGRVKLEGAAYQAFKKTVHETDRWRCVVCRRIKPLTVHHLRKRSQLRLDTLENCVSLCFTCHEAVERRLLRIRLTDPATRQVTVARHAGEQQWTD